MIAGEFIGAERGIGRLIIEVEARAVASGMMIAVVALMLVGVILSALIWRLQTYFLRWQPHNAGGSNSQRIRAAARVPPGITLR